MKKRILALILSVLTIMSFTACKKADLADKPEIGTQHDANGGIKKNIITYIKCIDDNEQECR